MVIVRLQLKLAVAHAFGEAPYIAASTSRLREVIIVEPLFVIGALK
jgi:hypothetical protein